MADVPPEVPVADGLVVDQAEVEGRADHSRSHCGRSVLWIWILLRIPAPSFGHRMRIAMVPVAAVAVGVGGPGKYRHQIRNAPVGAAEEAVRRRSARLPRLDQRLEPSVEDLDHGNSLRCG